MIYLDYSATTPVDERVLDSYCKVTREFIGNANSIHTLGMKSKELLMQATNQIADILNCHPKELIFTSGASESNTTAIKGVAFRYVKKGKHIICPTPGQMISLIRNANYIVSDSFHMTVFSIIFNKTKLTTTYIGL